MGCTTYLGTESLDSFASLTHSGDGFGSESHCVTTNHPTPETPTMRRILTLTITAFALFAALFPTAAEAQSAPVRDYGMEAAFIQSVNAQRAAYGLPALTANASMGEAAASWALSMASGDFLAHAGDITGGIPAGWSKAGENVGRGKSVDSLTTAFMNSPSHRAAILDPEFELIGVGVYIHPNGKVFTAHRFANTAPAAPVQAAPVAQAAPAQEAPVETAPAQEAPVEAAPAQEAPATQEVAEEAEGLGEAPEELPFVREEARANFASIVRQVVRTLQAAFK